MAAYAMEGRIARVVGDVVARASRLLDVDRVWLFGSFARGTATLETTSRTASGHRTIEDNTCQGLANATALIVALMIDPDAVAARTGQAKDHEPQPPPPVPTAPVPSPAPAAPAPGGARTTSGLVGVAAAGNAGAGTTGAECYLTLYLRTCATCAAKTLSYNVASQLVPEMEQVWLWFDQLLGASAATNPRNYCKF